jgi:hypothetical protein
MAFGSSGIGSFVKGELATFDTLPGARLNRVCLAYASLGVVTMNQITKRITTVADRIAANRAANERIEAARHLAALDRARRAELNRAARLRASRLYREITGMTPAQLDQFIVGTFNALAGR